MEGQAQTTIGTLGTLYQQHARVARASIGIAIASLIGIVIVMALGAVTVAFLFTAKRQATDAVTDVKGQITTVQHQATDAIADVKRTTALLQVKADDVITDVKRTTASVRRLTDGVDKSGTASALLELPGAITALKQLFGGASAVRK